MNIPELLKNKKSSKQKLINKFGFPNNKVIGLINIDNDILIEDFLNGLSILDVNFIIKTEKKLETPHKNIFFTDWLNDDLVWLDFILCDNCESNMSKYFTIWVTPIISTNNAVHWILSEFNPWKVTWNAYIFQNNNKWDAYYALVRYLENFKFPYDNKALIKNVLEI